MSLNNINKTVLITGSSGYIGKALCIKFLELDYKVFGFDLKKSSDIDNKNFFFIKVDLTDEEMIINSLNFLKKKIYSLDVLINNARPLLKIHNNDYFMDEWDIAHSVLLKAPAIIISETVDILKKSEGSIINLSSTNSERISHQSLGYHVSKAGMNHLTKFFADKLGEMGIRVNSVSPGVINKSKRKNSEVEKKIIPLQRSAEVMEIVDLILFLSSNKSSYINGQNIVIDGGMSLKCPFHSASKFI